jgi:hypothetical protein
MRSATRRIALTTGGSGFASLRLRISAVGVSTRSTLSSHQIGIDRIETSAAIARQRNGATTSAR